LHTPPLSHDKKLTLDSFNPQRWIGDKETVAEAQSPAAKLAFHPFGAGARSCIGIHLARMELRYATAFFFRECRDIRLAASTTPESMEFEVRHTWGSACEMSADMT
jgi:cytochrome P450